MGGPLPLVAVVDDDASVLESLPALIRQLGFSVQAFDGAAELLASEHLRDIRCLIVNVGMPGMSGLELLHKVKHRGYAIPIIFRSDHGGESLRRRLLEEGASECLLEPLTPAVLLGAIELALRMG